MSHQSVFLLLCLAGLAAALQHSGGGAVTWRVQSRLGALKRSFSPEFVEEGPRAGTGAPRHTRTTQTRNPTPLLPFLPAHTHSYTYSPTLIRTQALTCPARSCR